MTEYTKILPQHPTLRNPIIPKTHTPPSGKTIEDEAADFQDWLETSTDCSGGTPRMYASYIKRLDEPLDFESMHTEQVLNTLRRAIRTKPVRSAFKKYLQFKLQTEDLPLEAAKEVTWVQTRLNTFELSSGAQLDKSEVLRKYLKHQEIQEIVSYIDDTYTPKRFSGDQHFYDQFYLLPVLLFETGCRISELIGKQHSPETTGVRRSNLDFEKNQLKIHNAKHNKERYVDFDQARPLLEKYVDRWQPEGKLFTLPYWKTRYEFGMIGKVLFGYRGPNQTEKETGQPMLTPHWFRHSFATNWVIQRRRDGASWAEAKEQVNAYLDHDDMATTEAYIGAAKELVRQNIYEEHGGFKLDIDGL